jgi:hypothetical protein
MMTLSTDPSKRIIEILVFPFLLFCIWVLIGAFHTVFMMTDEEVAIRSLHNDLKYTLYWEAAPAYDVWPFNRYSEAERWMFCEKEFFCIPRDPDQ